VPHERIYAELSDPTWNSVHPTDPTPGGDDIPPRDCHPGAVIQWHPNGSVALATGDLTLDGANEPELPAVNVLDFLPVPDDYDPAAQSDPLYGTLSGAIEQAIAAAYQLGMGVPRYVWFSRENINHMIRIERRARTAAFGADE
jgi:hypothetical protein